MNLPKQSKPVIYIDSKGKKKGVNFSDCGCPGDLHCPSGHCIPYFGCNVPCVR